MVIIETMSWRNFLSYGNQKTTYDFKNGITRFFAPIGQGKSTVIDVLYYGVFGKPYRKIKLDQLINQINKKRLEVEITFLVGKDRYHIERSMKPDKFKIYKNGKPLPESSKKANQQQILEETILKMNERVFNSTVIKSMTKSFSFFDANKTEKRKIIENLMDIEIFSNMRTINTNRLAELNSDLRNKKEKRKNTEGLLRAEKTHIERLKKINEDIQNKNVQQIQEYSNEISLHQTKIDKLTPGFNIIEKTKQDKIDKLEQKNAEKEKKNASSMMERNLMIEQKSIIDKVSWFTSNCPSCPRIETLNKEQRESDLQPKIDVLRKEIDESIELLKKIDIELSKMDTILANESGLIARIASERKSIVKLQDKIKELSSQTDLVTIDETKYNKLQSNIESIDNEIKELFGQIGYHETIQTLLEDTGIKSFVIGKYLPIVNKLINSYLQKFEVPVGLEFDQEFNEEIKTRYGETLSYFNFSEGQKKLIDLSIIFAFLSFSKLKNQKSDINLLILDEIDSGLDPEGRNTLYSVLKDISEGENKEIITVSHAFDDNSEILDRAFSFQIKNGFTEVTDHKL